MKVDLDFTNVKSSGKIRVPEGDYLAKIKKVEKTKSKSGGNPMLVVEFMLLSGDNGTQGKTIRDNHVLTENSLWTLRNMLEAVGYKVPAGPMKFTDKMVLGKKVGLTLIDGEEYKGRISSEVGDYISPSVLGNKVSSDEAEYPGDRDAGDDDDFAFDAEVDEDEIVSDEEEDTDDDSDDDDAFAFDDEDEEDEEDEEEEDELTFDADDVEVAKAADLKGYYSEAVEAGWEFDLPSKPKAAQVREALLSLFADTEEEDDDDEMEDFDLDDIE